MTPKYNAAICAATSSCKFSLFFAMPSPISKRAKRTTVNLLPITCETFWLSSFTKGRQQRFAHRIVILSIQRRILYNNYGAKPTAKNPQTFHNKHARCGLYNFGNNVFVKPVPLRARKRLARKLDKNPLVLRRHFTPLLTIWVCLPRL